MNVTEAVQTRRSVRAFTDQPVERETLTRILEKAQRSPSGGNTQPWHGIVLTGEPMQALFIGAVAGWARTCTALSQSPARRRASG